MTTQADKRNTGRSTRMLVAAMKQATEGRAVYVMLPNVSFIAWAKKRLQELGYSDLNIGHISFETASSLGPYFDWESLRVRGMHPNCVVLVDHFVIEQRYGKIFEMMTMFDEVKSAEQS